MKTLQLERYMPIDSFDYKYRLVISEGEEEKVYIDNINKIEIPFMTEINTKEKELKIMSNSEREIYKSFCETLLDMIERIATGKRERI